ncbi:M15 family metallopeptidase [Magnetospirillum fulvum]|uniref:D-alanyl-D-alanine dipeptidase n=1 Tax=Magnetospirillum fulvum TaxID=1082 RepID=A0A1H6HGU4_MAGFU|nr:M15 family metallopeptidase [Magnetospirillum fulvum]SEH35027.1 D-Ala-D-Ala dipeptidase vanX. Metallo peptidase. MEROPS family M15D [Magnetospirillum fulvum]
MRLFAAGLAVFLSIAPVSAGAGDLPEDFVRLRDIDSTISQDIRYAGPHNFIGVPVDGYLRAECWLTRPAALALKGVQDDLRAQGGGHSLIVFDCYRPQRAVDHFVRWAADPADTLTRAEFYPDLDKRDLFRLGYIAERSGHSRGSTVDVGLTGPGARPAQPYRAGQALTACTAPYRERFADGGLDLGTGYDCFDSRSHPASTEVGAEARENRRILAEAMEARRFVGIAEEYWHFTLRDEPYPDRRFDVPVE